MINLYYTPFFYQAILLIIVITWIHTFRHTGFTTITFSFNKKSTLFLFIFSILYMGLRPINGHFGDMKVYRNIFNIYANGGSPPITNDIGFYSMMKLVSYFQSSLLFFFIVDLLYIVPLYIAVKRWFPKYYFFAFLILVASFSFWTYGTNGLRNGMATSFMLLAFSFKNNKMYKYVLFLLAFSFHSSMLVVIIAYFLSVILKNSKIYFSGWLLSIILSISMGTFWETIFMNLGFGQEDKLQAYFGKKEEFADQFASTGFRWDFLIYSSTAVIIAYYFIMIKKFKDPHYKQLVNIYLLVNSFWILVIRASFSNRFAYLSWFMMGIIIIYPFLKKVYWKNQFSIIGYVILLYFSFTYFMNVII